MHADHQKFLDAIAGKRRLTLRFFHRKEGREVTCTCAPLDFGPLRGAVEQADHYQLWNLQGKKKPFNVAVLPADVLEMTPLEETFDPAEIIQWKFKAGAWRVPRDWGDFS